MSGLLAWQSPDPLSSSSLSSEEEQPSLAMSADGALLFASGQAGVRAIRTGDMAEGGGAKAVIWWGRDAGRWEVVALT